MRKRKIIVKMVNVEWRNFKMSLVLYYIQRIKVIVEAEERRFCCFCVLIKSGTWIVVIVKVIIEFGRNVEQLIFWEIKKGVILVINRSKVSGRLEDNIKVIDEKILIDEILEESKKLFVIKVVGEYFLKYFIMSTQEVGIMF